MHLARIRDLPTWRRLCLASNLIDNIIAHLRLHNGTNAIPRTLAPSWAAILHHNLLNEAVESQRLVLLGPVVQVARGLEVSRVVRVSEQRLEVLFIELGEVGGEGGLGGGEGTGAGGGGSGWNGWVGGGSGWGAGRGGGGFACGTSGLEACFGGVDGSHRHNRRLSSTIGGGVGEGGVTARLMPAAPELELLCMEGLCHSGAPRGELVTAERHAMPAERHMMKVSS